MADEVNTGSQEVVPKRKTTGRSRPRKNKDPSKARKNHQQKDKVPTSGAAEGPATASGSKEGGATSTGQSRPAQQKSLGRTEDGRNRHESSYNRSAKQLEKSGQPDQMERAKMEEERRQRWHLYFMRNVRDLVLLDRKKVIVMPSVSRSKPMAQFHCQLCNYFCDNMAVVRAHLTKPMHHRFLQENNDLVTLRQIPDLPQDKLDRLNMHLLNTVLTYGLTPEDLESRRTIQVVVSKLVSSNLKDCSVRMFGSSLHGMGLKKSDVNLDLNVKSGISQPDMLNKTATLLCQSSHFETVRTVYDCEYPHVSFMHRKNGETCSIGLNNDRAVNLAILLSKYTPLDPRVTQLAALFRYWGEISNTDRVLDGTWPPYVFSLMTIFYLQQCEDPILPVLQELLDEREDSELANTIKVLSMSVEEIKKKWTITNTNDLPKLWIGLLKFYASDFNYSAFAINIDSSTRLERRSRKIFIVDPFQPNRNVAHSIISESMFMYIMTCMVTTCKYYCIPQTNKGAVFGDIYSRATTYHPDHEALLKIVDNLRSQQIDLILKMDPIFGPPLDKAELRKLAVEILINKKTHNYINLDEIPDNHLYQVDPNCRPYQRMSVSPSDAEKIIASVDPLSLKYTFSQLNFTGGKKFPQVCGVCREEDHTTARCPECVLPPMDTLPPFSREDMQILNVLCHEIFEEWRQHDQDILKREDICQEIEDYVREFYPTAKLELFGSTKNGFGLKDSDLDICLTFEDNPTGEGFDARSFVEDLSKLLRRFKNISDVLPIPTAKVPIVKFTHKASRVDADISVYNVLAMENSKMLCMYSLIDVRVRMLGYMMKRFAKICHIGDASKGSLSSYAYTLLVIHFLQQCDPPVLPVLQELPESGDALPTHMVEGCNAYFYKDLSNLAKVWPGRDKNGNSVGQLWRNMLIYYSESFDFMRNVVCIRRKKTLTKFEKLWVSKGIAIEDPFDLSHNLGCALTRRMSLFIIRALMMGRNHFGYPIDPRSRFKRTESYYFDAKKLTDRDPPNDRGCRNCKSIGHKGRDCPDKKKGPKQTARRDKGPMQSNDSNHEEGNGEMDNDSDEEGSLTPHRQVDSPRRQSNETPNRMQNPDPINKVSERGQVLSWAGSPASPHSQKAQGQANSYNQNQSKQPRFQNRAQNSSCPPQANSFMSFRNPTTAQAPRFQSPGVRDARTLVNPPMNQSCNASYGQRPAVMNSEPIPTIVFENSKLLADHTFNQGPQQTYQLPNVEAQRPPPGFVPINQNPQRQPVLFALDQRALGPASWNDPFHNVSQIAQCYGAIGTTSATPRPPVGPPFSNSRYTNVGQARANEQQGYRQPLPNQPSQQAPIGTKVRPIHALNESVANMQLNLLPQTGLYNANQQNLTDKDNQTSYTQFNFPPNNKTGSNDCL